MSFTKATRLQPQPHPEPKRRKLVRKEVSIHLRVTEEQKARLTEAAARAGLGVSSWLLMLGLRAARRDGE
jgi:uncharacterized protein (DUF1778 family)